jgi:hypothetical protein
MREWNWTDPSVGPPGWHEQLQELRVEILALLAGLDDAKVNWRPSPDRWSIAECVDHLGRTNEAILGPVRAALEAGRRAGRTAGGPFRYGLLGRGFLRAVAPPQSHRLRAARPYRPAPQHSAATLAADFARVQDEVQRALDQAAGLDLARIRARSPAVLLLRLPVGIWFASMAAHEARHLSQARAVRADPRFPGGP